jgi:putative NADH-flavin reductase
MTSLAIIGGTGYSGTNIAAEATRRGLSVTSVSRSAPSTRLPGVAYLHGDIHDQELVSGLARDHDVLVVAIHAVDGDDRPVLPQAVPAIADAAAGRARLGFVGGAGSSLLGPDGPRLVDSEGFPEQFKPEALAHGEILDWLRSGNAPADLEWFYVSPAAEYGSYAPGVATGSYRTDADLLVTGEDGSSKISGPDFARAFVDEIETPAHPNARFTTGQ